MDLAEALLLKLALGLKLELRLELKVESAEVLPELVEPAALIHLAARA